MFSKLLSSSRMLAVLVVTTISLATTAHAVTITHDGVSITMDFVTVGDPGNVADTTGDPNPCGAVGYRYSMGTYEVSNNQWDPVAAADPSDLLVTSGDWGGKQPVASINWHEAAMFCNWLTSGDVMDGAYTIVNDGGIGKVTAVQRAGAVSRHGTVYVIPTEDEWYKAAYYKGGGTNEGYWDYPTQVDSPSAPDGFDNSTDVIFDAVFRDPHYQGFPNEVDYAGKLSAYGTMGQGGNISEWTETEDASYRAVRGGAYTDFSNALNASFRSTSDPTASRYLVLGFRVASIPEPGSITLLLCGLSGLIWWRRWR